MAQKSWSEFPYKVFVSYSHDDRLPDGSESWGAWLKEQLEAYDVPPKLVGKWSAFGEIPARIRPVFRDRTGFSAAQGVRTAIREALNDSATMIVVCGPNAAKSEWVEDEIAHFKRIGRSDRIFALIVAGEPESGGPDECFPPALIHRVDAEGRVAAEREEPPLAGDARTGRDGPQDALLKVISGLLQRPLAELRQETNALLEERLRAQQRQNRRLVALAGGSVLAAAAAVAGLWFAWISAIESGRQRDQAVANQGRSLAYEAQSRLTKGDFDGAMMVMRYARPEKDVEPGGPKPVTQALQSAVDMTIARGGPVLAGSDGNWVESVAVSPDGKKIVVGRGNSFSVWSALDGRRLRDYSLKSGGYSNFGFDRSGAYFIAMLRREIDSNERLAIWNAETGVETKLSILLGSQEQSKSQNATGLSPAGKYAFVQNDRRVEIWDIASVEPKAVAIDLPEAGLNASSIDDSGRFILTNKYRPDLKARTVQIWDAQTGKAKCEQFEIEQGGAGLTDAPKFDPSPGSPLRVRFETSKESGSTVQFGVSFYDAQTCTQVGPSIDTGAQRPQRFLTDPQGEFVAIVPSGSDFGAESFASVYDQRTGVKLHDKIRHQGAIASIEYDIADKRFLTTSNDGTIALWDARSGERLGEPIPVGPANNGAVLVPGRSRLVVWGESPPEILSLERQRQVGVSVPGVVELSGDGALGVIQKPNAVSIRSIDGAKEVVIPVPGGEGSNVPTVWFSCDGACINLTKNLAGGAGVELVVIDIPTGTTIAKLTFDASWIDEAVLSPDRTMLLLRGTKAGTQNSRASYSFANAELWNLKTGQKILEFKKENQFVEDLDFSRGGDFAVIVWNNEIEFYDVKQSKTNGAKTKRFAENFGRAEFDRASNAYSVLTSKGREVRDADSGELLGFVPGADEGFRVSKALGKMVRWRNDYRKNQGTFTVHDIKSGLQLGPEQFQPASISQISFLENGKLLRTRGGDNSVRTFDIDWIGYPQGLQAPLASLMSFKTITDQERVNLALASTQHKEFAGEPENDCDRLAAYYFDPQKRVTGTVTYLLDASKAIRACEQASKADPQNARFLFQWGYVLDRAGEYDAAYDKLVAAAEKDYAAGFLWVGFYKSGVQSSQKLDRVQNWQEALTAFKRAAEGGVTTALQEIAKILYDGRPDVAGKPGSGVKADKRLARSYIERGAAAGVQISQESIAKFMEDGRDPGMYKQDREKALLHFALASELPGPPDLDMTLSRARKASLAREFAQAGKFGVLAKIWAEVESRTAPKPTLWQRIVRTISGGPDTTSPAASPN